ALTLAALASVPPTAIQAGQDPAVQVVPAAGQAPMVADPPDISALKAEIKKLEGNEVEATALNRIRMRLIIALFQRAISLVPEHGNIDTGALNESILRTKEAESYNLSMDTGVLNDDDRRVYFELQALGRKAIAQQVAYLKRWIATLPTSSP